MYIGYDGAARIGAKSPFKNQFAHENEFVEIVTNM